MHNILAVVKWAESIEIQRKSRNLNGLRDFLFVVEMGGVEPATLIPYTLKINDFLEVYVFWFTF